jgi:hypothetical protein
MSKTAEQMRRHNAHPKARERRRLYMRSEKGKMANRKAQVTYRKTQPAKVAAQQKVRSAGSDAGHRCHCGKPATHKHHTSYGGGGKIQWLCHAHHVRAHHPKSNLGKGFEPQAKPGQTGKFVGEAPAKPVKPARFEGRVDKAACTSDGEPFSKPSNVVRTAADEAKWKRAKASAKKQGQSTNYRLIMHIFQQMKKSEGSMETLTKALDAQREEEFAKAVDAFSLPRLDRDVLLKGMGGDDWHTRFAYTPYEAQALKIEEDYQRGCAAVEKEAEERDKQRQAIRQKVAKLVDKEAPYYARWEKKSALRESYTRRKRALLLKLLEHQRKQAEARKSLAKAEKPGTLAKLVKSQQEGPMTDLSSIYDEIRGRDVDQELVKAKAKTGNEEGEPDPEKMDKKVSDYSKGEVPMVGDAAGTTNQGMAKTMNSTQHGETTGQLGSPSANGTAAGGGGASGGQEFNSEAKTGMPSTAGEYSTEQWSDDDEAVEQQLKEGGMKPLERTVPHGGADLGQNATMDAPGTIHKAEPPAPGLGMSQAYATQIGANDVHGVGIGVQAQPEPVEKSETPVRYWGNGLAIYSDGDDEAIAKAQDAQGYITPEPTLGIPNSPLTQGCVCINDLCKAQMPSFITVCPQCGIDRSGGGYPAPHGAVIMQKSVAASLRPQNGDVSLPNGIVLPKK